MSKPETVKPEEARTADGGPGAAWPVIKIASMEKNYVTSRTLLGRPLLKIHAVDGVDLEIQAGEVFGLVGESGCGKSTLGRLILRLEDADRGRLEFKGTDLMRMNEKRLRPLRKHFQVVFQDPQSSLDPRMKVGEVVAEPLRVAGWRSGKKLKERVDYVVQAVGLSPDSVNRYPHEMSGGQRQRVAVARALATDPDFIVLDEPTSALDVSVQAQVLNLLKQLSKDFNFTFLFISHNMAVVNYMCDRVAVMYLGQIVELAPTTELFRQPLHPYSKTLLQAVPRLSAVGVKSTFAADFEPIDVVEGDPPSPANPPPGCRFHTRCPLAQGICSTQRPALKEVAPGHQAACHMVGGAWPVSSAISPAQATCVSGQRPTGSRPSPTGFAAQAQATAHAALGSPIISATSPWDLVSPYGMARRVPHTFCRKSVEATSNGRSRGRRSPWR